MFRLVLLAALAAIAVAGGSASAHSDQQGLAVTSSIDGKRVLPQMIRWLAHPNVAPANVAQVDYLIDGKLRWTELQAPYNYASDDYKGHLGYLFTSWLSPGKHTFTVRVKTTSGRKATDVVTARVAPAPEPPAALAGTWARTVTDDDLKKSDPRFGADNTPPAGAWKLIVDSTGIWELDPIGTGLVQAYSVRGDVLRALAPIQMVPRSGNDTSGGIKRFGAMIGADGGVDCVESGPFGTYRWAVSGTTLTLTGLDEGCGQRRAIYEGTWTRVS